MYTLQNHQGVVHTGVSAHLLTAALHMLQPQAHILQVVSTTRQTANSQVAEKMK